MSINTSPPYHPASSTLAKQLIGVVLIFLGGVPLLCGLFASFLGGNGGLPNELKVAGYGWQVFDGICAVIVTLGNFVLMDSSIDDFSSARNEFTKYSPSPNSMRRTNYVISTITLVSLVLFCVALDIETIRQVRNDAAVFKSVIDWVGQVDLKNEPKLSTEFSESEFAKFRHTGIAFVVRDDGEAPVPLLEIPWWFSQRATGQEDLECIVIIDGRDEATAVAAIYDWNNRKLLHFERFESAKGFDVHSSRKFGNTVYQRGRRTFTSALEMAIKCCFR